MSFLNEVTDVVTAQLPDAISVTVGEPAYRQPYRPTDGWLVSHLGRRRLTFSRFYFTAKPPVVVDFVRDIKFGEEELAARKGWCRRHGYRYVLAKDAFDGESVEKALAVYEPEAEAVIAVREAARPLLGPRRR